MHIAIVEDHPLVCEALKQTLSKTSSPTSISIANTLDKAKQLLTTKQFDILFLDLNLGAESGLDVLKYIAANKIIISAIVLTANTSEYMLSEALKNGAKGFLSKEAQPDEIKLALATVVDGGTYVGKNLGDIANKVLFSSTKHNLTAREVEIITLLADGLTYKEIGEKLFISPRTVEAHRNHILEKLNLPSVIALVRWALQNHVIL